MVVWCQEYYLDDILLEECKIQELFLPRVGEHAFVSIEGGAKMVLPSPATTLLARLQLHGWREASPRAAPWVRHLILPTAEGPPQPLRSIRAQQPLLPACLLYTSPSPRDRQKSRMPSSA